MSDTEDFDQKRQRSGRSKLLALMAIAVVPVVVAYLFYFYLPAMVPEGTTNQGQLITPPYHSEKLVSVLPDRKWYIVQVVDGVCQEDCLDSVHLTRQLHTALGKESVRVRRAILQKDDDEQLDALLQEYRGVVQATDPELVDELSTLAADDAVYRIFIVDPNGNVMMWYRGDQIGKPILKDLKHLLRVSNIG